MSSRLSSGILAVLVIAVGGMAVTACSKAGSSAAPIGGTNEPKTTTASAGQPSYEVVTVQRPESLDAFHKIQYYGVYKMCALTRETNKLPPPPPMKVPPPDYVSERRTYTSDGKAYLLKDESFMYRVKFEPPSYTCETYLEKTSTTTLIRDGKLYVANFDETGKRTREPTEAWLESREESQDKTYTERKTVKGYAAKCMPGLPNSMQLLTEVCIADLKPGTLTGAGGDPIIISSRAVSAEATIGPILTEPVSIKVGGKINTAEFDAAAAP